MAKICHSARSPKSFLTLHKIHEMFVVYCVGPLVHHSSKLILTAVDVRDMGYGRTDGESDIEIDEPSLVPSWLFFFFFLVYLANG